MIFCRFKTKKKVLSDSEIIALVSNFQMEANLNGEAVDFNTLKELLGDRNSALKVMAFKDKIELQKIKEAENRFGSGVSEKRLSNYNCASDISIEAVILGEKEKAWQNMANELRELNDMIVKIAKLTIQSQ
eukprot:TRINITY_DN1008_c0_g1_i2.p1 TRINITY_DN1008_c0_g1~~TRINITY_DN1008_c0_g1_i2.p1  ORF type:complete len:131 (-),score=19.73 TRINITY_DN1008_c0_g1_i2:51-443(-)